MSHIIVGDTGIYAASAAPIARSCPGALWLQNRPSWHPVDTCTMAGSASSERSRVIAGSNGSDRPT